ncbi:MAG: hypothetical protein ABSE62_11280 [Chthoniobacteraceae bacterium]|jgi:hypothetical protein
MKPSSAAPLVIFLLAACVTTSPPPVAQSHPAGQSHSSLTGTYEYRSGDGPQDVDVTITISHGSNGYHLGFEGGHPDGNGAAPDGDGTGQIGPDGVFRFDFEDSFSNRGTGTFRRTSGGYALSINITTVADSSCMMFYGDMTLHRITPRS